MRSVYLSFLAAGLVLGSVIPAQSTTDVKHYQLEIALDFATSSIQGTNTATFASLVNGLTSIDLDLHSALAVSAVTMNGNPVPFSRPTDTIRITLDRAYQQNEQFAVTIAYGGVPPRGSGFAGLVFTTHSGSPMAWTLSEPWDAKTWWPGKDVLVDKAAFDIWIVHPDTMTAVSNGKRMGIDPLPGNRLRTRWRESHPMVAYLASLAVTNYQTRVDTYNHLGVTMPVEFYVFPESWSGWQTGMNRVVPMLVAFSNVYGQYPFADEKYGIAQFTWGGGMEHQTVSSQSSVAEWLTAHELAHQWWGDHITCATWHDIWLNEGFATFSEAIWAEKRVGGTLADYLATMIRNKPRSTSGTVYVYNANSINSIFSGTNVYDKGGWVLHMLRGVLGDTDFFQCLTDYRAKFGGGSATTADFRAVCEQTTGQDLGVFFDQWVMNGGSPSYVYRWRPARFGGQDYVYLQLEQTQTARPVFEMPVRVVAASAAGSEQAVVRDDERRDEFVFPCSAAPTSLAIDPQEWILRSTPTAGTFAPPFFAATPETVDVAAGAAIEYHIDQGTPGASRQYLVVLTLSGSSPGTNVLGLQVPINFDPLTAAAAGMVNSPTLPNFLGSLDANGQAVATFNLAPGVAQPVAGATLTAAYVLVDRFDFASRPVDVLLR